MNGLINSSIAIRMTSREIAELTDKRHDHVMADIRSMLHQLDLATPEFSGVYIAENSQQYDCFNLPKDLTLTLVAGYSVVLRKRIIDRWLALEAQTTVAIPSSFAAALRLAAEQQEQIEAQALRIAADAPKVEFAETICNTVGVCKMGQFAKTIGWGPNRFIERLRTDEVLMQNNLPFQKYIDRGYFRVIEKKPWTDSSGNEHPSFTTMVTGRGQEWLAKRYVLETAVPA